MLSRPICPNQALSPELDDCIYRCFELYRQRVLQRRAARKAKLRSTHQQSTHAEQYENLPTQPSLSTLYQSKVVQDLLRYEIPIEPTTTTVSTQEFQQDTWEYPNMDQSTMLSTKTEQSEQIIDTSIATHEIKETEHIDKSVSPVIPNTVEQVQEATIDTEDTTLYKTLLSKTDDSNKTIEELPGSSTTTGTIEYTSEMSYDQRPILSQTQTSDNQEYTYNDIPIITETTYDQNIGTEEQIVSQQPTSSYYEEDQYNIVQETSTNEEPSLLPTINDISEKEHIETYPFVQETTSTFDSQSLVPHKTIDADSNEDEEEDKEILDLRNCICHCFGRFNDTWIEEEQTIHEHQLEDIEPIVPTTYIEEIEQPVPIQPDFQMYEVKYADAFTQTKVPDLPIIPEHIQEEIVYPEVTPTPVSYEYPAYVPEPEPELAPVIPSLPPPQKICAVCCCAPGRSLIKKIVYKQIEG